MRRVGAKKANESKPLMTCRNRIDGIKTEGNRYLGTSLGESLLTAQVVPCIEVARAWLRLPSWTLCFCLAAGSQDLVGSPCVYVSDNPRLSDATMDMSDHPQF